MYPSNFVAIFWNSYRRRYFLCTIPWHWEYSDEKGVTEKDVLKPSDVPCIA